MTGSRSGLLHDTDANNPLFALGLLLPALALVHRRPAGAPVVDRRAAGLLGRLVAGSFGAFVAAHVLLFRLHNPSRFGQFSMSLVLNLAAGIVVAMGLERILVGSPAYPPRLRPTARLAPVLLAALLCAWPMVDLVRGEEVPDFSMELGKDPSLYRFLGEQPKDAMVAGLSEEMGFVPTFAARSVLVAREYSLPYQLGYYGQFRRRIDLIRAQYSADPRVVRDAITTYGIDYWVLDTDAYSPGYLETSWTKQYPLAVAQARTGGPSVLQAVAATALFTDRTITLDAVCVTHSLP